MIPAKAHSNPCLRRFSKVYELIGSRWVDQGTAYCFGQLDDSNQAFLIARSEADFDNIILSTAIRSNDVYQRQQGATSLFDLHGMLYWKCGRISIFRILTRLPLQTA